MFNAQVRQIQEAPINVQNVITYDVVLTVDNNDLKLFRGMTDNARIFTDTAGNVLRVPNTVLRLKPPEAPDEPTGALDSKTSLEMLAIFTAGTAPGLVALLRISYFAVGTHIGLAAVVLAPTFSASVGMFFGTIQRAKEPTPRNE